MTMKRLKEIAKALKSVVLSMAHMDLQIDVEEEEANAECVGGVSPPSSK